MPDSLGSSTDECPKPGARNSTSTDDPPAATATTTRPAPSVSRSRSSRFSLLLEKSVDYTAYRTAYGRQFLRQQPRFDSLKDAEVELECVLHDETFVHTGDDGSIVAENVALAVDWFISALVLLFDGEEPFQNPDFLRLCCMFFASPLYENNERLVQRHLVKRTYAELSTRPGDAYKTTLWLLLVFLHLITEFQPKTYQLCKDSGLFPLLQRLVLGSPERHLHVLAMSLMFEIVQAVSLSQTDATCVTDELLLFLLEYVERMRFAESDVYNNTGTKLVLALNEQFLKLDRYASIPSSPLALLAAHASVPSSPRSPVCTNIHTDRLLPAIERMSIKATHTRTLSVYSPPARRASGEAAVPPAKSSVLLLPQNPALRALPAETRLISRSRSMDFRSFAGNEPGLMTRSGTDPNSTMLDSLQHGPCDDGARDTGYDSSESIGTGVILGPRSSQWRTPVVAILARRIDCCKTFTENLVFLLNRETDPATQVLILHMLYCILSDPDTLGILYTNDMYVLVDIIIRDLSNLSDSMQRLSQAYLCVVGSLLRNPVFLSTRHRLSDIELCLVNMLRQSLVCSQKSLSVASRRGSAGSSSSTRHNSITSDIRRESRAASPASSLSSSVSEETCCPRSVEENHGLGLLTKPSRRPAPPPPPHASHRARASSQHPPACLQTTTTASINDSGADSSLRPPVHRRRAPPPPPRPQHRSTRLLAPLQSGQSEVIPSHALLTQLPADACVPQRSRHRRPAPLPPTTSSNQSSPSSAAKPAPVSRAPPPPLRLTEHTGLRRQLSVKNSVSIYKRGVSRPAPPPPKPRHVAANAVSETADMLSDAAANCTGNRADHFPKSVHQPMVPSVHISPANGCAANQEPKHSRHVSHGDAKENDMSAAELADGLSGSADSGEERRATRRLVEAALRCCHEARILAASRSLPAHTYS